MAYCAASELGSIRSELQTRREECDRHARAISVLEVRVSRLEALAATGAERRLPSPRSPGAASPSRRPAPSTGCRRRALQPQALKAQAPEEASDSEGSPALTSDLDEEDLEDEQPPESFFSYCALMLTDRRANVKHRAAAQLLLYVVVLSMFAGCFLDASRCRVIMRRWEGSAGSYDFTCLYQGRHEHKVDDINTFDIWRHLQVFLSFKKVYAGVSFPFLFVGGVCVILLALYLKDTTLSLMSQVAIAEAEDLDLKWKLLVLCGEVVRTLMVPLKVAAGAALQLSQSADVADLILNAFAATFVLEMDSMWYALVLSPGEKQAYQLRWKTSSGTLSKKVQPSCAVPNCVFGVDTAVLTFLFLAPRLTVLGWSSGDEYQTQLAALLQHVLFPASAARAVLMQVWMLQIQRTGTETSWTVPLFVHVMLKAALCVTAGLAIHTFWRVGFATDPVYNFRSITRCLDGVDSAACTCDALD